MILVCGASGLVGKELCNLLDEKNIDYIGTYNNNKIDKPNYFKIDFSNPDNLETFLIKKNITCCVFSIVERLTDVCENDWNKTKQTNIELVHITSFVCNKLNIRFVHISTDYVFDGSRQPNYPDSPKNPLQNYGISKLISEYRVQKNCSNYCIIRTPVLYSENSKIHDNAVTLIGKNLMDLRKTSLKEDNYCLRRPLFIKDLVVFIIEKCCSDNPDIFHFYKEKCLSDDPDIFHFYNPYNKYSKYEMCNKIQSIIQNKYTNIKPNNEKSYGIAARPYDTDLCDNKYDIKKYRFTDFDKTLDLCFNKYKLSNVNRDSFFMIDLDGTLINSSKLHYEAYEKVFQKMNKTFVDFDKWNNIINSKHFDDYMKDVMEFSIQDINKIKQDKLNEFQNIEEIEIIKNADMFISKLNELKINYCVVTNTGKKTIEIFKEKQPMLKSINNWIVREDYQEPKPNSECFELAIKKYGNNSKNIVGIEDSEVGFKALKDVTPLIFMVDNYNVFKNNDCYIFNDYIQLLNLL